MLAPIEASQSVAPRNADCPVLARISAKSGLCALTRPCLAGFLTNIHALWIARRAGADPLAPTPPGTTWGSDQKKALKHAMEVFKTNGQPCLCDATLLTTHSGQGSLGIVNSDSQSRQPAVAASRPAAAAGARLVGARVPRAAAPAPAADAAATSGAVVAADDPAALLGAAAAHHERRP